ncbi:ATP-binding SpoIIE family protein phosphatase [Spartinivicinus ruber]|uniref:ATP-binding SpoIIE family protein phosphatase n=1 Tax=Spartinivicinus ruber TaxID=2683272 RepID=UPI0013D1EE3F|nr:fused response regulator/phosphatase [Spartinivicinus ruber]
MGLTILIADDTETDRLILKTIVTKLGHRVVIATDGAEAVELYQQEHPALVLLDVMMPNVDGLEAARQIKTLAGEELVPIIFLTSLTDAESLARCLDVGGDDFLSKPYNATILRAKINAFNRMRMMHNTLQEQRDKIVEHNQYLLHEQTVAKEIFDKVAHSGCLNAPNLRAVQSPFAIFNGDIVVAARKPSGGMMVLLGDFAGHGLPAAIGAMPLSEIFYGMIYKGFSMPEVLAEINGKLKKVLPVSSFCCAVMVDIDFTSKLVKLWIGGLPDCYLYRSCTGEFETLASQHLPLGILGAQKFNADYQLIEMADGDRLLLMSDGVIEAQDESKQFFGVDRLLQVFKQNQQIDSLFNEIRESVFSFIGEPTDDLTMVEVTMVPLETFADEDEVFEVSAARGAQNWSVNFEFRPETLRHYNPIPLVLHCLMEIPGLGLHNSKLYTILSELYSNALEHGVLQMSSSLKHSSQGFSEYYAERESRLQWLKQGYIRFSINHQPTVQGGSVQIRVEDSGPGFNYQQLQNAMDDQLFHGRGVSLLRSFCQQVVYLGKGNCVEVVFAWTND